jgi:hypothetical protein
MSDGSIIGYTALALWLAYAGGYLAKLVSKYVKLE